VKSDQALLLATSAAMATLVPVAAYQLGWIDHLPDPPAAIFASDEITESKAAHPLGIPDSLLGLGSYGTTCVLVLMAREYPAVGKLLAAKLVTDGSVAGIKMVRQVVSFGRLCSWCTGTALCTACMLLFGRKLIASQLSGSRRS
jgi:uncharacterized membrane protein